MKLDSNSMNGYSRLYEPYGIPKGMVHGHEDQMVGLEDKVVQGA